MSKRLNRQEDQLRARLAQEAARIMVEGGIRDFALAKRKAADRLGTGNFRLLPCNQEIESARLEYLRLFRGESQPRRLRQLRQTALQAMSLLERFMPRLVGPVLSGSADDNTPVHLHLFTDTPELINIFLEERGIPFQHDQRRVRLDSERQVVYPVVRLIAGEIAVEATIFPVDGLRQAPLSPVDSRPMQRADQRAVEELLTQD